LFKEMAVVVVVVDQHVAPINMQVVHMAVAVAVLDVQQLDCVVE
jgi:hypothetical protein